MHLARSILPCPLGCRAEFVNQRDFIRYWPSRDKLCREDNGKSRKCFTDGNRLIFSRGIEMNEVQRMVMPAPDLWNSHHCVNRHPIDRTGRDVDFQYKVRRRIDEKIDL